MGEFIGRASGEFDMQQQLTVAQVATLDFAHGAVGRRHPLTTEKARSEFGEECVAHTVPVTKPNTADCGDERLTIALGDGTVDRAALQARVVRQLFGGLALPLTKALVAADAVFIQDAPGIWEAYLMVSEELTHRVVRRLDGTPVLGSNGQPLTYEDGGHKGCGASKDVENSVKHEIGFKALVPAVGLLVPDDGHNETLLGRNLMVKQKRLDNGFYSQWKPADHEAYLQERFPQNFSILKEDPNDHETHGHNGSGFYVLGDEDLGYVKTGRAFSVNTALMRILAHDFGGSTEERRRILLGFADDTLHVGGGIVTPGFPVFA